MLIRTRATAKPIEDVVTERIAGRDPRVLEVVGRIAAHLELLHDAARARVDD